ncbi:MAG: hypothetical protein HYX67_07500, partial [Candidatus Melainabacteria bacterium]|nr:hypothetical protein [Candidatus Melainabacteria bacterium]
MSNLFQGQDHIQKLLNCVLREMRAETEVQRRGSSLHVRFLRTNRAFLFRVGKTSFFGNTEYLGTGFCYEEGGQSEPQPLSALDLGLAIYQELNQTYTQLRKPDFIEQIEDSLRVSRLIAEHARAPDTLENFMDSERSLLWGHPFHPSPKSRLGFSDEQVCN